ncbi:MAG: class I tRNA ligase family protein, partial [bacterium]|nr:class I tRNA ligase family protein [bacterium]
MTGQVPFEKVYLHGLVRTREGKKMSKSNPETCIDPLDVIEKYGADALRLSLFVGSSAGNDSRLYDEKISGYRNFVNKLWNVARYMLITVKDTKTDDPKPKTVADKWILSKLARMVESTSKLLDEYKFSQAAEELYAFTWNDLADWYLEVAKIEGGKDDILMSILRTLLKLWHPFTPYVTEELWKHVGSAEDMLMAAEWPEFDKRMRDESAEKDFELLRGIISTIRNLRSEYGVEPVKKVSAYLSTQEHQKVLEENQAVLKGLARLESLTIGPASDVPEKSAGGLCDGVGIHLPLGDLVDADKEKERLEKEIMKLEQYIGALGANLSNKQFTQKAPADRVQAERERLENSQDSLKKLRDQLKQLS